MPLSVSSSKKILILHATAGAGHKKAAEAIYNGLCSRSIPATLEDALDHTNSFFRKAYSRGYEFMIAKLPNLWSIFFDLTDKPDFLPVFQAIRRIYNGINCGPLVDYVKREGFDVVVTTHFLSAEVMGHLRRKGELGARLVVVVTDFDVHKIWLSDGVDTYLVASDYTKKQLAALGVDPAKIVVTGIPVDEKFVAPCDKGEIRRKLGLDPERFTVLLSTSSFGMGPIEELADRLENVQMIIICGNNRELLGRLSNKGRGQHKVCGFVDNMEEMMAASDVMLTKPGGLSVTEALANHLPLIFFSAIPGQEAGNVRVLAEHGIGIADKSIREMAEAIEDFAAHPDKLAAAREATRALARPDSVGKIIENIL